MHSKKTGIKGLILILAGLVALAAIAVMPSFGGGTTHAGPGSGINLNRSAAVTEFIIPGVPVTTLDQSLSMSEQPQFGLRVIANIPSSQFPKSGEILVGNTELMVYDQNKGCQADKFEFCIIERAKVGEKKNYPPGTLVQLATQTTEKIDDTDDAVQCDLDATITVSAQPSIPLQCGTGQAAAFGKTGFLTVAHSETVVAAGNETEYMRYDNNDSGCTLAADQLCIVARALQPGNNKRAHLADGFTQPCTTNPNDGITCTDGVVLGRSIVTKHFQITVKTNGNEGFFPTGPLHIYTVDSGNNIVGSEIISYNNAADKVKDVTIPGNQFHAVTRGGFTAALNDTPVSQHPAGSIVTGAHGQLVCRNGSVQPGVDVDPTTSGVQEPPTQLAGTSVASYPVCQTRTQPGGAPKTFPAKKLSIPIIGSTLVVLNAVGVPFLSTGGLFGTVFGDVPLVDDNGTDDGTLVLTSPCIINFTPGTNLKVDVTLDTSADDHAVPSVGTITVVLDTIPGPTGGPDGDVLTHDDCDDPAGTGVITSTTYSYYDTTLSEDGAGANTCSDTIENGSDFKIDIADPDCYTLANGATTHDTDGDGCSDVEELNPTVSKGGLRDPWNGFDYYDVNGDGDIDVPNDILPVILAYLKTSANPGSGGGTYTLAKDRGGAFGPFAHNRGEPDDIIEVPNDILPVILQYLNNCTDGP